MVKKKVVKKIKKKTKSDSRGKPPAGFAFLFTTSEVNKIMAERKKKLMKKR